MKQNRRYIKRIVIILSILILPIAILFVWTLVNYLNDDDPNKRFIKPYGKISSISISSDSDEKSELIVGLRITNHLPFSFMRKNFHYQLIADGEHIIKGNYPKEIVIPGSSTTEIFVPMVLQTQKYNSLVGRNDIKQIDSIRYDVNISYDSEGLHLREHLFEYVKKLPTYHIPKIHIKGFKLDSIRINSLNGHLLVGINNPNIFPLSPQNIHYEMIIRKSDTIKGSFSSLLLKEKSETVVKVPLTVSSKKAAKKLFRLLKSGVRLDYVFHLNFIINAKDKFISGTKVHLNKKGVLKKIPLPFKRLELKEIDKKEKRWRVFKR